MQQAREIDVLRETFAYAGGTRDPFNSLINLDKQRPRDRRSRPRGRVSGPSHPEQQHRRAAGEGSTGKRHKLRVGDQLGRSRLTQIRARDAVFTIQDFGFERQETLSLRKQEVETP